MRGRGWILPGAAAALLAGALVYAFWPRAEPVDAAIIARGLVRVTVGDDAVTRARDVYAVSAPISGHALRLPVHVGDAVVAGRTILAEITPSMPALRDERTQRELIRALQASEAARSASAAAALQAEADAREAGLALDRVTRLHREGFASPAALDAARSRASQAAAAAQAARAATRQRQAEAAAARAAASQPDWAASRPSGRMVVRAPVSGTVLRLLHESEGDVQAGETLLEIGDPLNIDVVLDLLSRDAVKVSPGDRVLIEHWGGDGALNGRVRLIEPAGALKVSSLGIEEQRVNVLIDLIDPASARRRLGHGYQVEAAVVLWEGSDVLRAPLSAVFRSDDDWAVFVIREGRARLRPVQLGRQDDLFAQVLDGLDPGDIVIVNPGERIRDGLRVEPR